jgi:lysophospholipase L1-like esterase
MADKKKLVLFGDSLLGCFGKDLIRQLEAKVPRTDVYNCAAGGLNSDDGVQKAAYIAKLEPDYVILSFGANDAAPWKKQVSLEQFNKNMDTIMRVFRGSKIIVFLTPPVNDPNEPEETKRYNDLLDQYSAVSKKVCQKHSVRYVDSPTVYGNLLKSGNDYHMGDGVHLDEKGYEVFIDQVAKVIKTFKQS